jgi:hypothetical protein
MSPGMLVSLWTGRVGMTTLVVLTVLAGRRFTSGMPFLGRLVVLVMLVIIVLVVASYAMRQAQMRRAASAADRPPR